MAKKEKAPPPADAPEGGEGEGAPVKKKLAGKQLILFIVAPAVLLLGGGGAAAYFLVFAKKPAEAVELDKDGKPIAKDKKDAKKDEKKKEKKEAKGGEGKDGEGGMKMAEGPNGEAFLTLPDILVNVATPDQQRPAYLKLRLTLQVKDAETADAISPALPRILDQYTGFLREMRMEDVSGSAGYARLQMELLKRVNLAVAPAQVDAVLVEEMLVQ